MAWKNIDQRRAEVARLLSYGLTLDKRLRLALCEKFRCSESAIRSDIKLLAKIAVVEVQL